MAWAVLFTFLVLPTHADAFPTGSTNRANRVIGQPDFTTGYSDGAFFGAVAANASTFHVPADVAYDSEGDRLFVADVYNARVLVFDLSLGIDALGGASLVLGQPDFTSGLSGPGFVYGDEINTENAAQGCFPGTNGCGLASPLGLDYDEANERLYVADTGNNRVLVWDLSSAVASGAPADFVLGQQDMESSAPNSSCGGSFTGTSACGLHFPTDLVHDPSTNRLYIADSGNNRVVVFDLNAGLTTGMSAVNALGQVSLSSRISHGSCDGGTPSSIEACGLKGPYHVEVDVASQQVFAYDEGARRILIYDVASGISNGMPAIAVLGQQNFTGGTPNTACDGLSSGDESPSACGLGVWAGRMEFDDAHNQLYVSDSANHRVLIFDLAAVQSGEPAIAVLGQSDFQGGFSESAFAWGGSTTRTGLVSPEGLVYDSQRDRLLVADAGNHRIIEFGLNIDGVPLNVSGEVAELSMAEDPNGLIVSVSIASASGDQYSVQLPSGTTPLQNNPEIRMEISNPDATSFNLPTINISAQLPAGTTKSITMSSGQFASICIIDHEDAEFLAGSTCNVDGQPHGFALPPAGTCTTEETHGDLGDNPDSPADANGMHPIEICLAADSRSITIRGLKHTGLRIVTRDHQVDAQAAPESLGSQDAQGAAPTAGCSTAGNSPGLTVLSVGLIGLLFGRRNRRRPCLGKQRGVATGACISIAAGMFLVSCSARDPIEGQIRGEETIFNEHQARAAWPAWAVPYGLEFWSAAPLTTSLDTLQIGSVVDRVSHAIEVDRGTNLATVKSEAYIATLGANGLRLTSDTESTSFDATFHTQQIKLGSRVVAHQRSQTAPWLIYGNTAQSLQNRRLGLVEHYEIRSEGVELTWVLGVKPTVGEALTVDVEIRGLRADRGPRGGLSLYGSDGSVQARISQAVLVDARGRHWDIAGTPTEQGARYVVDSEYLQYATFPVALDPTIGPEFAVSDPAMSTQTSPALARNSENYVVVWSDNRDGTPDIFATRIAMGSGNILDPGGIVVASAPQAQRAPSVASNGSDFWISWTDTRDDSEGDIYGTILAADGSIATSTGTLVAGGITTQGAPSVASDGNGYMVVWADFDVTGSTSIDIRGSRIDASGAIQDVPSLAISEADEAQESPSIASNGDSYFVAWHDNRDAFSSDIYGTLVNAVTGEAANAAGHLISGAEGSQEQVSAASNGSSYMLAWEDHRNPSDSDIFGSIISGLGAVIVTPSFPLSAHADGFPITVAGGDQSAPALSAYGNDYISAWTDSRSGNDDIYGIRISAVSGARIDPADFLVSTAVSAEGSVCLSSTGTQTLVAYTADGSVGARVVEAACGDAVLDEGESCDDGNDIQTDACVANCQIATCGDGLVEQGVEQCDGNAMGLGGESAVCNVGCTPAICGDGVLNLTAGEGCDDGNSNDLDECLSTCVSASCGDGFARPGLEPCDDGNNSNADNCLNTCVPSQCGDGFVNETSEECDDGNLSGGDACNENCGSDSDDDFISDKDETDDADLVTPPTDTDQDQTPDYLDDDSDNDGFMDRDEAGDDDLATPPIDGDNDSLPDFRDLDSDSDSIEDGVDNCRTDSNPSQVDLDQDGIGDDCDSDSDADGVLDNSDNCPFIPNQEQGDDDGDGEGDACDSSTEDSTESGCNAAKSGTGAPPISLMILVATAWLSLRQRSSSQGHSQCPKKLS